MASYNFYFIFLNLFVIWNVKRCRMKILFLAAVDFELDVARRAWAGSDAEFLIGGVGAAATQQSLEAALCAAVEAGSPFGRVVDIGIAGGCTPDYPIGTVVHVVAEHHGDRPGPWLRNPDLWPALDFLPQAAGRTLQELDDRWRGEPAGVESMEGATVFETCLQYGVPFAEIRAVSNATGERDHARWNITLALERLENALIRLKNER